MRQSITLAILGLATVVVGCGDDTDPVNTGGAGGTGAAGGGGTGNMPTGGQGGTTGGDGGEGGVPQGGMGGMGGETGAPTGEPCTLDSECEGGFCLLEEYLGWAGGYCTQLCAPDIAACAAGDECLQFTDGASACFKGCGAPADCTGAGQECVDVGVPVCLGGCDADSQCQVTCNNDTLVCVDVDETCDNAVDDDLDFGDQGFVDCEDADCADDATCMTEISGACTGATDISAGGTFTGSTTGGTNSFAALCPGLFGDTLAGTGQNERVFAYTAAEAGNVVIDVTTSVGFADWYLRTECENAASHTGFCGIETSGPVGTPVAMGQTVFLFVDGFDGDADFSVDVSFSATGPVCAAATTIGLGDTAGDTTGGSSAVSSACGGDGQEVVYKYTPAATGTLDLTLSSATDQGLHVRTDCVDGGTEVDCVDVEFGGTDELLSVPVTMGSEITIFVDAYTAGEEGPFTLNLVQ